MARIATFTNCAVFIYADDHNPPHFHIEGRDFRVRVAIADLEVIEGDPRKRCVREALSWARGRQGELALEWVRLNVRE